MHRLVHRSAVTGWGAAFCLMVFLFLAAGARAQDLEPRSYANTPVGLNFLIAGYGYTEGTVAFDPSLPIADAKFHTNTAHLRSTACTELEAALLHGKPASRALVQLATTAMTRGKGARPESA